ncbi:MAG: GNAT family N-acetyltransferase [Proteobacteria bacterium]|nr:GNAT family N-acetyltransferase [Pseudomonadota bacterium]
MPEHDAAVLAAWVRNYGGPAVVSRGRLYDARMLPGFVALEGERLLGALTWHADGGEIEIVSLDSYAEDRGVGTALLAVAVEAAQARAARRIWLITSNDNIRAIRFYQKRGWDMAALHRDAIDEARKIKPEIPRMSDDGIPIRHEIEFERRF